MADKGKRCRVCGIALNTICVKCKVTHSKPSQDQTRCAYCYDAGHSKTLKPEIVDILGKWWQADNASSVHPR